MSKARGMIKEKRRYRFPDGTNYPIMEATEVGAIIVVTEEDCAKAVAKDPTHCAIAVAAMRMGYKKAYIAGTVAYLVTTIEGEDVAVKFSVPVRTGAALKNFDESEGTKIPLEGFALLPLSDSGRAEHKRQVQRAVTRRRTPEQKARVREQERRRAEGYRNGIRAGSHDLRTFRYLSGQVRTTE